MLKIVYNPTTTIAFKFINLQCNLGWSYVKLVIELMDVDELEHPWVERNRRICLEPGLVDLQKFMCIDRYHLKNSTLVRICSSVTGLNAIINFFQ